VYQHDPPGASRFDAPEQAPFGKFAGAELKDFLFAKALECFEWNWSEGDVQDRVGDWHILKAKAGAFLSDAEVETIVARAAKVEKIAHNNAVYLRSRRAVRRAKKLQLIEKGEYYA
jgi:hypothetical protein